MLTATEAEPLPGRAAAASANPDQEDSLRCPTLSTEFVLDQEVEDFLAGQGDRTSGAAATQDDGKPTPGRPAW